MILRRLARWTLYLLIAVIALAAAGAGWLRSSWGRNSIRQMAISRSASLIDGELSIGSVTGSVFRTITFNDVVIKQRGVPVLTVPLIRADYSVVQMISSRSVALDKLTLDGPKLQVVQDANGWHVLGLATRRQTGGRSPTIAMSDIVASGAAVDIRPAAGSVRRLVDLAFETTLKYDSTGLRMDIARLTGRDPDTGVDIRQLKLSLALVKGDLTFDRIDFATAGTHLAGSVRVHGTDRRVVDLHIEGDRVSLPEIGLYVPAVRAMRVAPALSLSANGPLDAIDVRYALTSSAGDARGAVRVNAIAAAKTVAGEMDTRAVDIGAMFGNASWASSFTGHTRFTLTWAERGGPWPVINFVTNLSDARAFGYQASHVSARGLYRDDVVAFTSDVAAYGAAAKVTGRYDLAHRTFSGSGHAANVDLRRLPAQWQAPKLASTLAGDYTLTMSPSVWDATMTFAPSVLEGATLSSGTVAHVHLQNGFIQYSARGRTTNLDPQRITRAWPGLPESVRHLDAVLSGDFTIDASGSTASFATHEGTVTLALADSTIAGVHFDALDADAALAESQLTANARGAARGNMDRFLTGPPRHIDLNGTFEAHARIADINAPLRFENVSGSVLAALTGSTALGVAVDRADVDVAVDNGVATVKKLDIAGPDLHATADGVVALGSEGTSNLTYKIDAQDFGVLGQYRPAGLEGAASIAGTLTGPASLRATTGTLNARELHFGAISALTLTTKFQAEMPGNDFTAAKVTADSDAAFATVRDFKIDHLTAKTSYENNALDVDATFEQGTRHANVAGSLVIHPDHHEVHVRTLQLASGNAAWTLPAGTEARVEYTPTRVTIDGLQLAQGDERLVVDGTFGLSAEDKSPVASDLTLRADRVRVEHLTSLFLGPNVTGQLDGTARATGTLQDPHVVFDGAVVQGTVNTVPFDSVTGHADWTRERVTLDTELIAGLDNRLKVSGSMPFGTPSTPDAANDSRPIDLRMDGIIANVGLFAPFITHLDKLAGTGNIALRIAGTRKAPAIDGTVALQNVTFLVTPTGVVYRNMNAALRFAQQRMFVDTLHLEDDDGHVLTATGSLDVLEGAANRAVDIHATATSLHLLHNGLGEVLLDADLAASGDIRAPHITGVLDIERARLELDRILAELSISPYDPVEGLVTNPKPQEAPAAIPPPLPFMEGLSFAVDLRMPDNVVVRGRNIRIGAGTAGLGDLNATFGGTLHLNKDVGRSTTVLGTMNVVRGNYAFQGRRFEIVRGSEVRFRGLTPIDPALSISGERDITGVTAQVRVTGTLRDPQIALSSNPPLDEADILSLIMFNRSLNRLGDAEKVNLAETAGSLAAGTLTSPLTASVARALDLDVFDIQPTDVSGGGATLTVGRQVSERLFVGFKQAFGADETSRLTFEYRLAEFLRIISSVGQGATTSQLKTRAEAAGIDLIFIIK